MLYAGARPPASLEYGHPGPLGAASQSRANFRPDSKSSLPLSYAPVVTGRPKTGQRLGGGTVASSKIEGSGGPPSLAPPISSRPVNLQPSPLLNGFSSPWSKGKNPGSGNAVVLVTPADVSPTSQAPASLPSSPIILQSPPSGHPRKSSLRTLPSLRLSAPAKGALSLGVQLERNSGAFYAASEDAEYSPSLQEEEVGIVRIAREASLSVARRESYAAAVVSTKPQAEPRSSPPRAVEASLQSRPSYKAANRPTPHQLAANIPLTKPLQTTSIRTITEVDSPTISNGTDPSQPNFSQRTSVVYKVPPSPIAPLLYPPSPKLAKINDVAKIPARNLSITSRTTHLVSVPGYGWRIVLTDRLEKLNLGLFLSIAELSSILSMGDEPDADASLPSPSAARPKSQGFLHKIKMSLGGNSDDPFLSQMAIRPMGPSVFGSPLAVSARVASCSAVIGGCRQSLPIPIFATGEEIFHRGLDIPGVFRLGSGDPARVARLVQIFDTAPDYGDSIDLANEPINTVAAVFMRFLHELPHPVFDRRLWRLYLVCCVDSVAPLDVRTTSAQTLLRLLPPGSFSLLVYLAALLSQLLLPEHHGLEEHTAIALFGPLLFSARPGHPSNTKPGPARLDPLAKRAVKGKVFDSMEETLDEASGSLAKAQEGLKWLLANWALVSDGLLDPVGTARSSGGDYVPAIVEESPQASPVVREFAPFQMSSNPAPTISRQFDDPPDTTVLSSLVQAHSAFSSNSHSDTIVPPSPLVPHLSADSTPVGKMARLPPSPPLSGDDTSRAGRGLGHEPTSSYGSSNWSESMDGTVKGMNEKAPERSVLDKLLELDDSSAYSLSPSSALLTGSVEQSPASMQRSGSANLLERAASFASLGHGDLAAARRFQQDQSRELKQLWHELETSEGLRELAVAEVHQLQRELERFGSTTTLSEQRVVEQQLRGEIRALKEQLESIRGILTTRMV